MKAGLLAVLVTFALVGAAYGQSKGESTFDCTGKSGYFPDTFRLCHVFYFCYPDGRKLMMTCPDSTTFNESTGRCDNVGALCAAYVPVLPAVEPELC